MNVDEPHPAFQMWRLFNHPVLRAGVVLGVGLGAFLDGIVLHQILGWHHLICTTETCQPETIAALQRQNAQDGFFHLAAWALTVMGTFMLWRVDRTTSGRAIVASAFAGWGIFNVVEGLINHQLLGLHHVNPASPSWLVYDLGFLLFGALLVIVGARIAAQHLGASRRPKNI